MTILGPRLVGRQVLRAHRGPVETQHAAALEDAVDDGLGEIVVVEHGAPGGLRRLVGGEDHRASADVALVDDVVQDVRRVGAVREVADLVDDEHVRPHVAHEGLAQRAFARRGGEILDELRGGREEHLEAVLQRAIRDCDGEVRLAPARLADEDHRAPFGDEIGREQRADRRQSQRRLEAEVEFLDRAEEGKMRGPRRLGQARSTAVRDLLGEEDEEHVLVRPVFLLGTLDERLPRTARVSEVESLEERIEIGAHDAPRFGSARPSGSAT